MSKRMLISTVEGQECRIAIVSDGRLEELCIERSSSVSHVGNIYKGRITNVESAIQAAFIDFGRPKNGFLHISDVHPDYFPKSKKSAEPVGRRRSHSERPPIQDCLRRGQEVVVQMTKEGIGTKGPTMTTYLSIPGRLLVMMPGMSRLGVSRKIEDEEARQHARKIIAEVTVPENMGFIVRTAGSGKSKRDIQRDLNFLLRLWKSVTAQIKSASAPEEIYQESDLVIRTIRDTYTSEIERIICDDPAIEKRILEFLNVAVPRSKHTVELYTGAGGLYHDYGIEDEIEKIYSRHVELPSGGSLVIDQTEALVAIDVNSGRNRQHSNAEMTALRTNQEAASEIARQLRLRDLGGLVVIDFIDMREMKNRRTIDRCFREATKSDRAKTKLLRINTFGLMEMTRQRLGPSLKSSIYHPCEACGGMGVIKSAESQALQVLRLLQRACGEPDVAHVHARVTPAVAHRLNNHQRTLIAQIESDTDKTVVIEGDPLLKGEDCVIERRNARGSEIVGQAKRSGSGGKTGRGKPKSAAEKKPAARKKKSDKEPEAEDEAQDEPAEDDAASEDPPAAEGKDESGEGQKKSRRRGRRGGRGRKHAKAGDADKSDSDAPGEAEQDAPAEGDDAPKADEPADEEQPDKVDAASEDPDEAEGKDESGEGQKKSRRRGRRGGRGRKRAKASDADKSDSDAPGEQDAAGKDDDAPEADKPADKVSTPPVETGDDAQDAEPKAKPKRRRRRAPKKAAMKTAKPKADESADG